MPIDRIILAPDSFKGTLGSPAAAAAMAAGVRRALGRDDAAVLCPVADGGEGTLDALVSAMSGDFEQLAVDGPLGDRILARYGLVDGGRIAVIEMAQASGLTLVPEQNRDPTRTTSYGTGEFIAAAIERSCKEIIVCIGGSGTVDGAAGMAQACGFRFIDDRGNEIRERMSGGLLQRIARIERPLRTWPRIRVACDVTNPLCGANGASAVYGPQKGATPEQVQLLDAGLAHLAMIVGGDPNIPGAGAAGGAGYGLVNFFNAKLERGIDLVLDAVGFRERCRGASLVITGEGRLDAQSLHGKAVMGVAKAAHQLNLPTFAVVGSVGEGAERCLSSAGGWLDGYIALADEFGKEQAMRDPAPLITEIVERIVRKRST